VNEQIRDRILAEAKFILDTGATVRACARKSGVGKTTVHKDMRERLPQEDKALAARVAGVLDRNRSERHLRGGEATRRKYRAEDEGRAARALSEGDSRPPRAPPEAGPQALPPSSAAARRFTPGAEIGISALRPCLFKGGNAPLYPRSGARGHRALNGGVFQRDYVPLNPEALREGIEL